MQLSGVAWIEDAIEPQYSIVSLSRIKDTLD